MDEYMGRPATTQSDTSPDVVQRHGLNAAPALMVSRLRHVSRGRLLRGAERTLGVVTLVFWGWWFADGYGRDLVHSWRTQQPQAMVAAPVAVVAPVVAPSVLGDSLPISVVAPEGTTLPAERPQPVQVAPVVDPRPTRLEVPSIGLDSTVTEVFLIDGAWQVAEYAVGYHHGTGLPGAGNVVLAGHKGLRGSVFAHLEALEVGDDIWLDAGNQRFQYQVSATGKVMPDQISIMQPSDEPILTLITCTNWDTERFVAFARLVVSATAGGTTEHIDGYGVR